MKKIFLGNSLSFLNKETPAGAIEAQGRVFNGSMQLAQEAEHLSNYGGGGGSYIGVGDDFLNFAGDYGSFADPIHSGKYYTITLTNSDTDAHTALLCPGLLRNAVGLVADGAFNDTLAAAGLSGNGGPMAIAYFNAFIDKFPTIVAGFKVSCSNDVQFTQNITIQKQSPFHIYDSRIMNVGNYANPINPNPNLIEVQESFYMDCETAITYTVLPATTVAITLYFGASLNIAFALRAKAEKAQRTLATMGGSMPVGTSSFRGRSLR